MHDVISRLERLLTLLVLLVLGIAFSGGLLSSLDWRGVLAGVFLVFLVRPLTGWLALAVAPRGDPQAGGLGRRARVVVAAFGVRGVGSIFYLAYATREGVFADADWIWSTTAFTIALSVVVHGVAATPLMKRLEAEPSGSR
jgi:NhaP-type Na+/H+ or K+/H+ antiporter